jgi:hypothetical protein
MRVDAALDVMRLDTAVRGADAVPASNAMLPVQTHPSNAALDAMRLDTAVRGADAVPALNAMLLVQTHPSAAVST